ncbi:ABC transporter permease [Dactylosporangium sp. NPDC048998]|uniref:ABC transporter permease n=1 Tax=Dactylosporangium sp. NPDC048998 TaxID=3363976 RepID=UPI003712B60C
MTLARAVRLYLQLLSLHLRALMEYEYDFWIMAAGTLLTQVVNLVFISALFARVPALNGWSYWAVVAMFGLLAVAEGVGSLCFEGTWRIAEAINTGSLDYLLVRPYPVVLQVTSAEVGVNGLTNVVTGGIMIGAALVNAGIAWSPARVLVGLVLLLSAVTIKLAINLATNCVSFWLSSPNPHFAMAVHQVGDLARFPISIYPPALKVVLGVVVPFAFVTVFPVGFVMGMGTRPWLGLLTPVVAALCLAVALFVFRTGLRRYESAGN